MAFVACILDLSHVLAGEQSNQNGGTDKNTITGLIVAREIGFGISIGLRFFFFWLFVAEPPREEYIAESQPSLFSFKEPTHSGAWGRWGLGGVILKYSLLAIVFIIGIFQIDWRVAPGDNKTGAVYGAEATMEIVASALFIFKLVSNTYITPVQPVSRVLQGYTAIFIALLINLGLGIGNVATCKSTQPSRVEVKLLISPPQSHFLNPLWGASFKLSNSISLFFIFLFRPSTTTFQLHQ